MIVVEKDRNNNKNQQILCRIHRVVLVNDLSPVTIDCRVGRCILKPRFQKYLQESLHLHS